MRSPSLPRWIPALIWLRAYDRSWLRRDVLAGVTLAAYLLPAALGDASLALGCAQAHARRKPQSLRVCRIVLDPCACALFVRDDGAPP